MTVKRQLLHLMKNAIAMEETLIPIYTNHCTLFSDCLDFGPDVTKQLIDTFVELRDTSREHRDIIERVTKALEAQS